MHCVEAILHSGCLSTMVNGLSRGYFACIRGVRQKDPLSPLLFCLADELLGLLVTDCIRHNKMRQISARRDLLVPPFAFYADDVIFFLAASAANISKINNVLDVYALMSGQVVNPNKAKVYFGNSVHKLTKNFACQLLYFSMRADLITYLGAPIYKGALKARYFCYLMDDITSKFLSWKGKSVSIACRLCLIKVVIGSIFVHSMRVYMWPIALLKMVERVMHNFLWTGCTPDKGKENVTLS